MFINWLISKNSLKYDKDTFSIKYENNFHQILFNEKIGRENFYWNENKREGVFIIGYLLPSNGCKYITTPENILKRYKSENSDSFLNYKGNYTIIIVLSDRVVLVTDLFGISKFFYNDQITSNNFWIFKNYSSFEISKEAVYFYSIFNYWIKDFTLYKDILKSEGGYFYELNQRISKNKYFIIKEFLRDREIKYDKHSTFKYAPEIWAGILKQYIDYFNNQNITQTLTAGLDSRMILAGFQKLNFKPHTFTFGNVNSMDVVFAKKVAESLNLPHSHFYPQNDFFNNFVSKAQEVVLRANGLSTVFRAHRFDAYKQISTIADIIFFGFIGSELIRGGVYPDGLIYPHFVIDYWLSKKISIKEILKNKFLILEEHVLKIVEQKIFDEFDFYKEPDTHIFELIIPLHFGQDIRLLETLGTKSVAPYWDIDFLNFQKSTPFFIDNTKKKDLSTFGHYKRMKGPVYSCKMIELLDKNNAKISLGKGYSPSDYNISSNYAAIKFVLHKYFSKKVPSVSNFTYANWFLESLKEIYNSYDYEFINKTALNNLFSTITSTDEYGLLPIANSVNISITEKIMNEMDSND